jgi:hypothetical protein
MKRLLLLTAIFLTVCVSTGMGWNVSPQQVMADSSPKATYQFSGSSNSVVNCLKLGLYDIPVKPSTLQFGGDELVMWITESGLYQPQAVNVIYSVSEEKSLKLYITANPMAKQKFYDIAVNCVS